MLAVSKESSRRKSQTVCRFSTCGYRLNLNQEAIFLLGKNGDVSDALAPKTVDLAVIIPVRDVGQILDANDIRYFLRLCQSLRSRIAQTEMASARLARSAIPRWTLQMDP